MDGRAKFKTTSRDIWKHGSGEQLRRLLSSALATLFLARETGRPLYVSSPWLSDFILFDNRFRQYEGILPELADFPTIRLSEYLLCLGRRLPVRIITSPNETSDNFLRRIGPSGGGVEYRLEGEKYHEKGILASSFYIEGSMNITYQGVYVRGEKIVYHCDLGEAGAHKISGAYLEFDRRWRLLGENPHG